MNPKHLDPSSKVQGAPTNGGQSINGFNYERREPTMFFFILKKNAASDNKDLIAREVQRHFEAWHGLSNTTSSRVQWIGNDLILATDNAELFEDWWSVEQGYAEYMLATDATKVEDFAVPDEFYEDRPLKPAA